VLHEVRCGLAELGAVLQHRNVFGFGVIATSLLAVRSRLNANIVTGQAVLNTLLQLYLTHLVSCVLLHFVAIFLDCFCFSTR
jgi:hypothetical protein